MPSSGRNGKDCGTVYKDRSDQIKGARGRRPGVGASAIVNPDGESLLATEEIQPSRTA
jgi:hypothetical protein